jgi:hypothetical protein
MSRTQRAVTRALCSSYAGLRRVKRLTRAAESFLEGLALTVLPDEGRTALTISCYRDSPSAGPEELFDWEREWFERDLPPPPSRILVGGAGSGREASWLERRGHEVVAFDPIPNEAAGVLPLSYEELTYPATAQSIESVRRIRAAAPYDAVLLGWGSFTHVSGRRVRRDLVQVLRSLSSGPLLVSFWGCKRTGSKPGRAKQWGVRVGRLLAGAAARTVDPADRVLPHCGYAHQFVLNELEALASENEVLSDLAMTGYPHATLEAA